MINNKTVLVTGGTGSFGKKFTQIVFEKFKPKKLIIFSRDEYKQFEMQKVFPTYKYPIRYFVGDIRDKDRVYRAFEGVDYVIHAAALKQVPTCEYNPFEAIKTNILGAQNIVNAAIDKGVKKVIALSTDKAVSPINLYGATKLAMEKLFIAANAYVGTKDTIFSLVRYGNVMGSRGSVIPFFIDLLLKGIRELPITDERMTRFWITLEEGVELVLFALSQARGGEVFIPKIPSMKIIDLAKAICPDCKYKIVGIRPGEKLHESLMSEGEARNGVDLERYYVILPQFVFREGLLDIYKEYPKLPEDFIYRSDKNDKWLKIEEMREMLINMGYNLH